MLILLKELWPVYVFQNLKWLVIYFMWSGLLFIVIIDLRSFCPTFYHVSNMVYERLGSPGCQDSFVHLLLCPHGYPFWSGEWKLNLKITETDAFSFSFSCYPTLLTSDQIHHGNLFKCWDENYYAFSSVCFRLLTYRFFFFWVFSSTVFLF